MIAMIVLYVTEIIEIDDDIFFVHETNNEYANSRI